MTNWSIPPTRPPKSGIESSDKNGRILVDEQEIVVYNDTEVISNIGDMVSLQTNEKASLVGAVNEQASQLAEKAKKLGGIIDVSEFGADNTGTSDSITAFENAVASLQPNQTLKAVGTFLLSRELQLNKDNVDYDFKMATFIGVSTGTPEGGLVTVTDRANLTHVVKGVTVYGGKYIPKNALDNGLNIAYSAEDITLENIFCDCTLGQRGVSIQNNQVTHVFKNIRINGLTSKGGKDALNIEGLNNSILQDFTINNVIGIDTENVVRISPGSSTSKKITGVTLNNIVGRNVRRVLNLNGVKASFSNIKGNDVKYRAVELNYCENITGDNIVLISSSTMEAGNGAIVCTNSCFDIQLTNIDVDGTWDWGIYADTKKSKFEGSIKGTFNTSMINTIFQKYGNKYEFTTDTTSVMSNSYRDGDIYVFHKFDGSTNGALSLFMPKGVNGQIRTDITSAPTYIGQLAVVNGVGYIGTGVTSATEWKQITN